MNFWRVISRKQDARDLDDERDVFAFYLAVIYYAHCPYSTCKVKTYMTGAPSALTGFDIEKFAVVLLDNTNEFSNSFFSAMI